MRRTALLMLLLSLAMIPARHATAATCTVSATGVAFGVYPPFSTTPTDSTGTITVSCTTLLGLFLNWSIALGPGDGGSYANQRMSNGTYDLNYHLYASPPSGGAAVWGDGTDGTTVVNDGVLLQIGTNISHYTIYGRIPPLQAVGPGSYSDTIVVTVTY
jgi:spore coat protein U-like protein